MPTKIVRSAAPVFPSLGAGAAPAGTSSGGSGSSAYVVPPPPAATPTGYNLFPDPITGQPKTGRFIDQTTGQYDIDAYGYAYGMGTVDQIVQIAVCNIDFSVVDVTGSHAQSQMKNLLTNALAYLINNNMLAIISISVAQFGVNGEGASLVCQDLTTGREFTTPIGNGG